MAVEEVAESAVLTPGEYVAHHLHFWQSKPFDGVVDFTVFNIDTILFSVLLAALTLLLLWRAAKRMTPGVPGRFQTAVEVLAQYIDNEAKGLIHNETSRKAVAPLGLSILIWITFMNTMDLLPVDLLPSIWARIYPLFGGDPAHAYLRVLPTADVSGAMGLSISVLLISLYYNIKIKGLGGWGRELVTAPFGTSRNPILALVLGIVNFAMQIVEFISKTLSHGLRLFGNMYAGELIFVLLAMLGGSAVLSFGGFMLVVGQIVGGLAWAIFHILIILLHAFIFTMLAMVYIGQAHSSH